MLHLRHVPLMLKPALFLFKKPVFAHGKTCFIFQAEGRLCPRVTQQLVVMNAKSFLLSKGKAMCFQGIFKARFIAVLKVWSQVVNVHGMAIKTVLWSLGA